MPLRPLPSEFTGLLERKEEALIHLYTDLRTFLLELHPDANELLYHTHALTSVYSITEKLGDAYCMIPVYTAHLNLGFNKGTLLKDPNKLLQGTGNLIRHIPITRPSDYRNAKVKALVKEACAFAIADLDKPTKTKGTTISKITR
ncbi:MAG: DUF1801 domain-containing protein [Flavobacteriales bacterium]|nr:DUF1801 domain-containing protein [Flavobacteriales bacterium]